ncbi:MAG: FKBP-type peptidyl-prolyl cis-trans isomerase [Culturomica sp.]|jgi:FKBP-type peptidyl-prolyl cis-trans isomerase FklB|nr:FKBP-type peptidyl-prolyl cis-trans isomerase [Culturomica sp.]
MKILNLFLVALAMNFLVSCNRATTSTEATLKNERDSASFFAGYFLGQSLSSTDMTEPNMEAVLAGMNSALQKKDIGVNPYVMNSVIINYGQKKRAALAITNLEKGKKFLEENAKRSGVVVIEDSIQYEVITEGNGSKPVATDEVKVHYEGKLIDGTVFDSSIERGEPVTFPLNRVIPGWTKALQHMPVGSKWKIFIPSKEAYGPQGAQGSIGPNETLIFEVELLEIVPPKAPTAPEVSAPKR